MVKYNNDPKFSDRRTTLIGPLLAIPTHHCIVEILQELQHFFGFPILLAHLS